LGKTGKNSLSRKQLAGFPKTPWRGRNKDQGRKIDNAPDSEGLMKICCQIVRLCSYNPAKIFGLYPQKGTVSPGSDADLILLDMERGREVNASDFPSSCDYTPYKGWKLKGWPEWTMVRGKIVMENGKVDENLKGGKAIGVR
jgi:N-acyl-D-aspartate/D-glutamate deacylase